MTSPTARILLITGSTRQASTNTAALRTAQAVAPHGFDVRLFDGLSTLPAFNPDDDHDPLPGPVAELRQQISGADAVLFCTPEYAGALPGSFKNLLDWTVGGAEMSGKPVGWISVAAQGRGENALASLQTVLGYVGAELIHGATVRLPIRHDDLDAEGLVVDHDFRVQVIAVLKALAAHPRTGEEPVLAPGSPS